MKVVVPKNGYSTKRPPILPLVRDTSKKITKDNSVTLKLKVNPGGGGGVNAPSYEQTIMLISGTEPVRNVIEVVRLIRQCWRGMNIDDDTNAHSGNQVALCQRIFRDSALDAFNASLERQLDEAHEAAMVAYAAAGAGGAAPVRAVRTDREQNIRAMNDVIAAIVPYKALQMVKRYLRRECRKPADMTARQFYTNLRRINYEEIPHLPPFDPDQMLSDDEIVDILLFALPKSWVREMDKQGFDPFEHNPLQIVEFMERIEAIEDPPMTEVKNKDGKVSKTGKGKSKGDKSKTCVLHGPGHSTEECRTIKAQAKKRKSDDGGRGGDKDGKKDWKKKSNVSTNLSKKELALLVKKQTRAELKSFSEKKRKAEKEAESDDAASVNAFDMEAFSYKDLEGLSLEDKKPKASKKKTGKSKKDDPDSMDEFKLSDDSDDDTVLTTASA